MATQVQVASELLYQLRSDSPDRLKQVGQAWMQPPLGFYYGYAPHSEIQVDIAIQATMVRVLKNDGTYLPKGSPVWDSLRILINTSTTVANAIVTMAAASAHAQPLPPVG